MRLFMLLAIVSGPANALADECEAPCPCEMREELRNQLVAGLVLFGAGHALGVLSSLQGPARPSQRLFELTPVFGTLDAAVRDATPDHARPSLIFFSAVQVIGIVLMAKAWSLHLQDQKLAMTSDGVGLRF